MEDRRYSIRKRLREYNVPVEEHIEAGDYSVSPVYKIPDHLFLRIFSYLGLRDRFRLQRGREADSLNIYQFNNP